MKPDGENRSVRELSALRPILRADLRFSMQEQGGERRCVIEDPAAGRFYRVGLEEYCFLRALEGATSVAALIAQQVAQGEGEALLEGEALRIIQWAQGNHLLAVAGAPAKAGAAQASRTWQRVATWLNPLSIKLPLGRPDGFFRAAAKFWQPVLSPFGFVLWLLLLGVSAAHLAPEWARFQREAEGLLARDNWLWISLGWILLKVVHECGHGIVCRHFGAPVREVGVMFILGLPLGYVDATASLALPSRGRRIGVAAAGLAAEFALAALAALVWSRTMPGPLHALAHSMILTGTVVTLFFNANPLMRFDGYFILADALDIPNLATRGRQWAGQAQQWLWLGGSAQKPVKPRGREEWLVALYGSAATLWQLAVMAGLLVAASLLLRGGGLLFAALAGVLWIARPLWQAGHTLRQALRTGVTHTGRLALRALAAAAVLGGVLFAPWHRTVAEPAVIELAETEILRAECAGFADSILVADGTEVAAGALLVELRNDEVAAQVSRTRLELAQQELRTRLAYTRQDIATFQAEGAKAGSLRQSLAQQESYAASLQVRAPFAGRVITRRLESRPGRYFRPGEEILRVGRTGSPELKIAVSARNEPQFRSLLGQSLRLRLPGRGQVVAATLTQMDAHASRENAWSALTALTGGPLALRKTDLPASEESHAPYELAEPCFTATALVAEDCGLLPGETGQVRFRSEDEATLWQELSAGLQRWLAKYTARQG